MDAKPNKTCVKRNVSLKKMDAKTQRVGVLSFITGHLLYQWACSSGRRGRFFWMGKAVYLTCSLSILEDLQNSFSVGILIGRTVVSMDAKKVKAVGNRSQKHLSIGQDKYGCLVRFPIWPGKTVSKRKSRSKEKDSFERNRCQRKMKQ